MHRTPDQLLALLESPAAKDRKLGLLWIAHYENHDFLGDVLKLLLDADPQVRERAAWTLDQLENPAAIPALIDALYDDEFGVRSNAGWALVHLGEQVVAQVIEVLQADYEPARQMAYQVLVRMESPSARDAIRRYWHWE